MAKRKEEIIEAINVTAEKEVEKALQEKKIYLTVNAPVSAYSAPNLASKDKDGELLPGRLYRVIGEINSIINGDFLQLNNMKYIPKNESYKIIEK